MGEISRTIIVGGLGVALVAAAAGAMMGGGSGKPAGETDQAVAVASKTAMAAPSSTIETRTGITAAFNALRKAAVPTVGITYAEFMAAERTCMTAALGREPAADAWPAYERMRLFMTSMRFGDDFNYSPDGTDRFRDIVQAIGSDPAAALEAGRIDLADVQFAESYMAKYLRDPGNALYDGLALDDSARDELKALVRTGQDERRNLETCLVETVKRTHGVEMGAEQRAEAIID